MRTIDEGTARKLAVKADCDPRTIRKVLRGEGANTIASRRARAVLVEAGLIGEDTSKSRAA